MFLCKNLFSINAGDGDDTWRRARRSKLSWMLQRARYAPSIPYCRCRTITGPGRNTRKKIGCGINSLFINCLLNGCCSAPPATNAPGTAPESASLNQVGPNHGMGLVRYGLSTAKSSRTTFHPSRISGRTIRVSLVGEENGAGITPAPAPHQCRCLPSTADGAKAGARSARGDCWLCPAHGHAAGLAFAP